MMVHTHKVDNMNASWQGRKIYLLNKIFKNKTKLLGQDDVIIRNENIDRK